MVAEQTKSARTEAELKDAARRLLVRKGYAETKISDITTEAGKAVGSFYRYFADKDALLRALAEDFEEALHAHVVAHMGHTHEIATTADVRRHVEAFWGTYVEHLPVMVGVFQAAVMSEDFRRIHHRLRERQVGVWTQHVRETRLPVARTEEGARIAALALVCMLEYFCYHHFAENEERGSDEHAIATLTDLIAGGLLGTPPAG